jgi:hypothetical protein
MSNNKEYKANYKVTTTFGHCPHGFKRTSGDTNTLANRGSKLITLPVLSEADRQWNELVNEAISAKSEVAIERLEVTYKLANKP